MRKLEMKAYLKACMLAFWDVPIWKIVSVTAVGSPTMSSENSDVIVVYKKDPALPNSLSYDCVIHQKARCQKW